MKIGIIGLGDIAKKAYLPVFSSINNVEFHLYTRNQIVLAEVANTYRFHHIHSSLQSLIESGIEGAFVHSSTESHEEIIRELLTNNIHVYVDKPITYYYEASKELVELAKSKNLKLMVGFNRRYAPVYQKLKELDNPNMIIVQKNRSSLPNDSRTFVMDDFIHVIDTMRFLFPHTIEELSVQGRKKDGMLYHVVVQFISSSGSVAIGIMNRDSGTREEKVEVMSPTEKRIVYNVADLEIHKNGEVIKAAANDWEPTLHKRGFEQMITEFIETIRTNQELPLSSYDALETHKICEQIIEKLAGN
ncbi:Gfo/Idh/MocA family protein [Ferdinandcohnia quinoae]|uniref:Gfo/Idh/MocA family oxidoreductase n=1 Tax=Fredinandcohnia quinoae TaxID=2918902 RepID=A0AAW5E5L0_9BACI|nr:Gfo/Idh/MocA family oxidoreductase [Fredinandcohnia sp. SECRCQ15]MCH1626819.1 Gfo/Idh/MocA family oxidoreductase [Fredinandcohnia sp. SECRCQ15]